MAENSVVCLINQKNKGQHHGLSHQVFRSNYSTVKLVWPLALPQPTMSSESSSFVKYGKLSILIPRSPGPLNQWLQPQAAYIWNMYATSIFWPFSRFNVLKWYYMFILMFYWMVQCQYLYLIDKHNYLDS